MPPLVDLEEATLQDLLAGLPSDPISDQERIAPLQAQHLAYLIYTSGSTGTPKGVGVSRHSQAISTMEHIRNLNIRHGDRLLQWAGIAFDVASAEISIGIGLTVNDICARFDSFAVGWLKMHKWTN